MKKTILAMGILGAFSGLALAASNVTLYGVIEDGVIVSKAKNASTTVQMKNLDSGSRWGIKGVEELGNGYSVGFILEQGFLSDTGAEQVAGKQFSRQSLVYVQGGFGKLAIGRVGTIGSGGDSFNMLTGWAFGTGYLMSDWSAGEGNGTFGRADNAVAYQTPNMAGFQAEAMYSNKTSGDDSATKWSYNNHYYGLGAKYNANNVNTSLVLEALDNKGTTNNNPTYIVNFGAEFNAGVVTPMFAYRYVTQSEGTQSQKFGLSAKVPVAGGNVLAGASYQFGKDKAADRTGDGKYNTWTVGAGYVYPFSKRTTLKTYAGYAKSGKTEKESATLNLNGWGVGSVVTHTF